LEKVTNSFYPKQQKNENVYDAEFKTKKQQKHEALTAQDNNLIAQLVS
jgi:transposase